MIIYHCQIFNFIIFTSVGEKEKGIFKRTLNSEQNY